MNIVCTDSQLVNIRLENQSSKVNDTNIRDSTSSNKQQGFHIKLFLPWISLTEQRSISKIIWKRIDSAPVPKICT